MLKCYIMPHSKFLINHFHSFFFHYKRVIGSIVMVLFLCLFSLSILNLLRKKISIQEALCLIGDKTKQDYHKRRIVKHRKTSNKISPSPTSPTVSFSHTHIRISPFQNILYKQILNIHWHPRVYINHGYWKHISIDE